MQIPALLLTCVLGLLALAYVLYPLYRGWLSKSAVTAALLVKDTQTPLGDSEQAARLSLQEVELDYQLGNIAESDYRSLRERYMRRAILAMKARHDAIPSEQGEPPVTGRDGKSERESQIDRMIEEQLREMRARNAKDDGGNDEDA